MTEKLARSVIQPQNPRLNVSRNANLPHVPGIRIGDFIFLSGMGPVDPETGGRFHGPIGEQVRMTLGNIRHMLESAGSSLERVLRVPGLRYATRECSGDTRRLRRWPQQAARRARAASASERSQVVSAGLTLQVRRAHVGPTLSPPS